MNFFVLLRTNSTCHHIFFVFFVSKSTHLQSHKSDSQTSLTKININGFNMAKSAAHYAALNIFAASARGREIEDKGSLAEVDMDRLRFWSDIDI